MTVKFNVKNVVMLGKLQVDEDTTATPAATNAIPVISNNTNTTRDIQQDVYLGDSLNRDEISTVKDEYGEIGFESFMPVLGALNPALSVAEAPFSDWFRSCGGKIVVAASSEFDDPDNPGNGITLQDGTPIAAANGAVLVTNARAEDKFITVEYRKSSPQATGGKQKTYVYNKAQGQFDLNFAAGERVKLAFKFLGNFNPPTQETAITPDFGNQKLNVASVVRLANMQGSTVQELLGTVVGTAIQNIDGDGTTVTVQSTGHGLVTGDFVDITGTTNYNTTDAQVTVTDANNYTYSSAVNQAAETSGTSTKSANKIQNMCVDGIGAPNFLGFEYNRFLLTCQEGFDKGAVPTDVTVTVLEDEAGGTDFDPEANLEKYFKFTFKYGLGAGKYVRIIMDKLQLSNVGEGTVANFFGKECTFRNTGYTYIIFE